MSGDNTDLYVKNESSYDPMSENYSNYTFLGVKISGKYGSSDLGGAVKFTDSSSGGFVEYKYTTPKFVGSKLAFESRTRFIADKPYGEDDFSKSLTQRLAFKGSWNLGKDFSVYEITGASVKLSLEGKGFQSVTPTSITGVGYNVNKNFHIYGEVEVSRGYSVSKNAWGKTTPSFYLGVKYTF